MLGVLFDALCATLDHFEAGLVVVFPDGRILHANRMAQEMMSEGWPIQSNNGCLQGCTKKATASLLRSLREAAETAECSPLQDTCVDICLADSASPKGVAIATLKPLVDVKAHPRPVALFVTDFRGRSDCALSAIAECFGLTPAETRTLHHFVEGGTVTEAGQALAVSENTIKTHLQNIFSKTRSSRQAQLVKLVNDLRPPVRQMAKVRTKGGGAGAARALARACDSHSAAVRL